MWYVSRLHPLCSYLKLKNNKCKHIMFTFIFRLKEKAKIHPLFSYLKLKNNNKSTPFMFICKVKNKQMYTHCVHR